MLVLLALVLAACGGPTTYVTIRHPLQVGGVDPNRVPFDQTREERRRQLPQGSLVDQAELVSLTPDQICARVTLWADQTEPERSNFNAYRIALLSDQDGVENTGAQINLEQPSMQAYQGVRRRAQFTGGYGVVRSTAESFVWQINSSIAVSQ
jgi:hypothetical protein